MEQFKDREREDNYYIDFAKMKSTDCYHRTVAYHLTVRQRQLLWGEVSFIFLHPRHTYIREKRGKKGAARCCIVFTPNAAGRSSPWSVSAFSGCIINKYDKKNSPNVQLLDLLNERLGNTLNSIISFSRVIKNFISGGLTSSEYMGWTSAAKSYANLAAEIRERV